MNSNSDKKAVACRKVFMHHFSGQFSMMEFEDMIPELLMRTLFFLDKWGAENNDGTSYDVARHAILFGAENNDGTSYDVARHNILFHLLKNNPKFSVLHENNDKRGDHKRRRV